MKEMLIHFFHTQIGANKDAFGVCTNLPAQRKRIRGFLFVEV